MRALLIRFMIFIVTHFIIIILKHTYKKSFAIDTYNVNNTIVNSHNYTYTLNPEKRICYNQNVNILIYIHSSPKNFKYRQFVRETWSNRVLFPNIRTVFMMGLTNDSQVNNLLIYEFNEYGDIVQENFLDTYRNLTIKAVMALKWIKDYCPNVYYIVKLDEDVLMNTFALLDYVDELKTQKFKIENTIMCFIWSKAMVQRKNTSKWFVTYDEIKADIYFDYCAGAAYILTPDLAALYFNISQYVKFFWIDDYYITGKIRTLSNTTLINIESKFLLSESSSHEFYTLDNRIIFGHFTKKINEFYRIWQKILQMNDIYLPESKILSYMIKI
jgi:beta-1,3-galactosyltransferase 1